MKKLKVIDQIHLESRFNASFLLVYVYVQSVLSDRVHCMRVEFIVFRHDNIFKVKLNIR